MNIASIQQAEQELGKLYELVRSRGPDGRALDRMWPLLEAAGNPHEKIKVIHVAGTSGKTSTCYYTAALLHASGKKVGLTVSPHVDSITERIQLDGQPISEELFCKKFGEFLDIVYAAEETPSYFEVMISFAYWFFESENVDYVVAETGLGGLVDGTNTVTRADKVCVITDIGMDHMHILGNTIADIASQKAGIIQQRNHVFMIEQPAEVMDVIEQRAEDYQASLHVLRENEITDNTQLPIFQQRNWYLSQQACAHVAARDQFELKEDFDPLAVTVPGRMEIRQLDDGTTLILDGAHNGQKIAAFVQSFTKLYPDQKAHVLLALKTGKEYVEVLENLRSIVASMTITSFEDEQDFPIVSQDPEDIAAEARKLDIPIEIIADCHEAFTALKRSAAEIKLVIGSIYLLGQIRVDDYGS